MEIWLIRHGQTVPYREGMEESGDDTGMAGGWPDGPLTALGETQAAALAPWIKEFAPQRVLSSDLQRAYRTAELACASIDVAVERDAALREIHMGRLHRENWDALRREDPAYFELWHAGQEDVPYPGGESGEAVAKRAWPVLEALAEQGVQRAVLFLHGGAIRTLLCRVLGLPQQRRFALGPFENTSITTLLWDGHRWSLRSCNDVHHLRGLGEEFRSV